MLATMFFCMLFSSVANGLSTIENLYDLSKKSVTDKSLESHLKHINQLINEILSDPHSLALAHILKAEHYLMNSQIDQSKKALLNAENLLDQVNSPRLKQEYNYVKGFLQSRVGEVSNAIQILDELYNQVKDTWPKSKLSHLMLERAYLYIYEKKFGRASVLLKSALAYALESGDFFQIGETYNVLGILYESIKDYTMSAQYFEKAIEYMKEKEKSSESLPILYANLGDTYREIGEYEKAQDHLVLSVNLAKKYKDEYAEAHALHNQAALNMQLNQYDEALDSSLKSLKLFDALNSNIFKYELNSMLAEINIKLGDINEANKYLNEANQFNDEYKKSRQYKHHKTHAIILAKENRFEEAYHELNKSFDIYQNDYNQSLINLSNVSHHILDQEKVNFDNQILAKENSLKQKFLTQLQEKNSILLALMILIALIAFMLVFFMFRYKKLAIKNHFLAVTDTMTNIANRRSIFEILEKNCEDGDAPEFSIIIYDIDFFKKVNDSYGHQTGDLVLKTIVKICSANLRSSDVIGRIGGEEFLIILPDTKSQRAADVAERIRKNIEQHTFKCEQGSFNTTASFGVAQFNKNEHNSALIKRADQALYESKSKGRNQVSISD